jgi:hypothetical protein
VGKHPTGNCRQRWNSKPWPFYRAWKYLVGVGLRYSFLEMLPETDVVWTLVAGLVNSSRRELRNLNDASIRVAGPQPPPGNPFEIVTAECDLVTMIHKNHRQDPTAEPDKFYEMFTFDTFRIKNGKLVEHWDGAVINPPVPSRRGQ